ncbi:hypothetical protein SPHINGO391_300013 [Sphingomonas aurantiaca]|uniref:Uncharacterized protein n=1 Tax=Sphingomonas aurantiaca TaxID=185949 RepID=A0A5E7XXF3_9SPHN|nr:hypothetical protein SPHINGO391_300013 [Sphingomonas aurantiaca]VXC99813.1 hypothetical protein SPHINGOT1_280058 [Sphingomonas sp. T1]
MRKAKRDPQSRHTTADCVHRATQLADNLANGLLPSHTPPKFGVVLLVQGAPRRVVTSIYPYGSSDHFRLLVEPTRAGRTNLLWMTLSSQCSR